MRNKSRLAGLFVALFVALSTLAFTGTTAQASKPGGEDERKPAVCHPVEGRGQTGNGWNIISPDKASSHIDEDTGAGKHTRKDGRTDVYAVDGKCPGPEIPEWFEPTYPAFIVPECQEYLIDKQVSTWDADTGTWSAWTDWGADAVKDDGRTRTGHHGGQHKKDGDRHFAYVVIPGAPITTGECAPTTTAPPTTEPPVTTVPPTTEPPVTTVPPTTQPPTTLPPETTQPPVTTEPPATTQPPTTEPPATTQPPVVVTTEPPTVSVGTAPTPPTQPPFTPTATAGDELPATGSTTELLLLIAAGMLGIGALIVRVARRNATIN